MADFTNCSDDAIALSRLPKQRPAVDIAPDATLYFVGCPASAWFPQHLQPRPGIDVVSYIYGRCLFEDVADALSTATSDDHRIYLLGWNTEKNTQLKAGKTLEQLLLGTKAQIRAMHFDGIVLQPTPLLKVTAGALGNQWISDLINKMPNGGSIMDSKHAQPATHHQKLLVIQGSLGVIAFLGGMDINPTRTSVNAQVGEPWHDVQVRVTGAAALDCRAVFQERWSDHPASAALDAKLGGTPFPDPAPSQSFSTVTRAGLTSAPPLRGVRIGRTYPNLKKTGGATGYGFAPQGIYTAWDLVEHGINTATRWIYLEDQYMVSRMARQLLLNKLQQKGFEYLLILMNGSGAAAADFKFLVSERNKFRRDLKKIDNTETKWGLFVLKDPGDPDRQQWCGTYMHSKTWIFDDEFTIVGSANCENRGYTLNTETIAAIGDDAKDNSQNIGFARQLRIALWHKHLGVSHSQLQDWNAGLKLWNKPPATAMVQKSHSFEPDGDLGGKFFPDASEEKNVEFLWTTFCDPDAR